MSRKSCIVIPAVILAGFAANAAAPERVVQLRALPPLGANLAAFPRLVATAEDNASQRINEALERRDRQVQRAAKECRGGSDRPAEAEWSRVISIPMRGPRYLSLVAADSWSCGGAHDDYSSLVLVYDLSTGSPVNWARLLPASIVQSTSLDTTGDGTQIGVLSSRVLQDLYLKAESSDPKNPMDPECKDVLNDPALKFIIWPDAREDGITIQTEGLPHVVAACGADPVVIPMSSLRKLGVQPELLNAIDAAHGQGRYDPARP